MAVDRRDDDEYRLFANFLPSMGAQATKTGVGRYGYLFSLPGTAEWDSRHFEIPIEYRREQPYQWSCYGVFGNDGRS